MAKLGLLPADGPAIETAVDTDSLIRSILFIAVFLSVWISFHPFPDLSEPPLQITEAGDLGKEIGFLVLFLLLALWSLFHEPTRLKLLVRPAMIVTLVWCGVTVLASWQPSLAASRFAFTLGNMGMAAMVLLLPKNVRHFSDLMTVAVLIVLAACYIGVFLAPSLAIHQLTDFAEPEHAGDWRGVFTNKNEAGATMVQFIFIGLFVARMRSVALGGSIITLATTFLIFTQSKTAIGILPVVLIVSAVLARTRRPVMGIAIAVSLVVMINLFSVGSVYFEPIHDMIASILPDPSFTGRTEIWQFALQHLAERPITGYGISAFWGTEQVVYGLSGDNWANIAVNAHNGYLDIALIIGIPGLALVIAWIVVLTLADYYRVPHAAHLQPLKAFFLQVCLYGIYASCFETAIFPYVGGERFLLMIAVFGLRYLSVSRAAI